MNTSKYIQQLNKEIKQVNSINTVQAYKDSALIALESLIEVLFNNKDISYKDMRALKTKQRQLHIQLNVLDNRLLELA